MNWPAPVPASRKPFGTARSGAGGCEADIMVGMMLFSKRLSEARGIRHGFFTRRGGVSRAPYDSLNCGLGSRDDADAVTVNRARAADQLGFAADALVTACQVHSDRVAVVERPWPAGSTAARPEIDALVSRTPGLILGILSADCAPVLLADPGAGVIGAAHAGWRGAKAGILEAAVAAMTALGARAADITAAVGPCIKQRSYEVAAEFRAAFVADAPDTASLFTPSHRDRHYMFDLAGYVHRRLAALGLGAIEVLAEDTASDAEHFFSYRRTTLAGGRDYGRGLSAIALEPR